MDALRKLDLNLLIVFQYLLEERNLSMVAKRLDLSQPAVSNALRRLRTAFDDELFVRTAQGMQPTPLAEGMGGPVAEALSLLAHLTHAAQPFDAAASTRRLRIAMSDVGEIYFMPRLMERCAHHAPRVRIDSLRIADIDLQRELDAGRVDLAIGACDGLGAGVLQRMLFRQGYATLCRSGHPRAHQSMSLRAFRVERHLLVSQAAPYGQVNAALERAGLVFAEHFSVPHFAAVPYIVANTDLLATVPEKLASSAAPHFGLQILTPPVRVPVLQTNLYWHRRFQRDGANRWLRDLIIAMFVNG